MCKTGINKWKYCTCCFVQFFFKNSYFLTNHKHFLCFFLQYDNKCSWGRIFDILLLQLCVGSMLHMYIANSDSKYLKWWHFPTKTLALVSSTICNKKKCLIWVHFKNPSYPSGILKAPQKFLGVFQKISEQRDYYLRHFPSSWNNFKSLYVVTLNGFWVSKWSYCKSVCH